MRSCSDTSAKERELPLETKCDRRANQLSNGMSEGERESVCVCDLDSTRKTKSEQAKRERLASEKRNGSLHAKRSSKATLPSAVDASMHA